jgi:hypothetical protein
LCHAKVTVSALVLLYGLNISSVGQCFTCAP